MYYTPPAQQSKTATLSPPQLFTATSTKKRTKYLWIAMATVSGLVIITGAAAIGLHLEGVNQRARSVAAQPAPTPSPQPTPQVAAATFGDILKQTTSYQDWLAGVNQGSVELVQPQTGQRQVVAPAPNQWQGPISDLYWSPDKTKLAALYLSPKDATAMQDNPEDYARSLGLASIHRPQDFPYGQITIIDLTTKQKTTTPIEAKNTLKSLVWLDNDRLATIATTLTVYQLSTKSSQALITAGNTNAQEQLQTPLVWKSDQQQLFFIKNKQVDQQTVQLLTRITLANSKVDELVLLQTANPQNKVGQTIDLALSSDQAKLALVESSGLSYIQLSDMSRHNLTYDPARLWLEQVSMRQLNWLNDHQLGFEVVYPDGSLAWAGWDIQQQITPTYAKGNIQASWSNQTGQLAVIDRQQAKVMLINPNWQDPVASTSQTLPLAWQQVYW